jgi:hypothetical protein
VKKNITCPCGKNIPFDFDEEIDLDLKPQILESILSGTFMSCNCPSCNKLHKPEFRVTINWSSKNLKLLVIPELERGEFYLNKKETPPYETIIGFPEMADRLAVIKDGLEPYVIETLKSFLLAKAEDDYPDNDINAWYHCNGPSGIEFHLDGIRKDEVAVMRIPHTLYDKTLEDYKKHPKNSNFTALRVRSYLSVQNLLRPDVLK